MLFCGLASGVSFLAGGLYLENNPGAADCKSHLQVYAYTSSDVFSANVDGRLRHLGHFLRIWVRRQLCPGAAL